MKETLCMMYLMKYIVEIINVCNEHHGNKQFKIIHELIKWCKVRLGIYIYVSLANIMFSLRFRTVLWYDGNKLNLIKCCYPRIHTIFLTK